MKRRRRSISSSINRSSRNFSGSSGTRSRNSSSSSSCSCSSGSCSRTGSRNISSIDNFKAKMG